LEGTVAMAGKTNPEILQEPIYIVTACNELKKKKRY